MVSTPFQDFQNSYTQDSEEDETEEPDFIPPPPPMTVWCLVPSDLWSTRLPVEGRTSSTLTIWWGSQNSEAERLCRGFRRMVFSLDAKSREDQSFWWIFCSHLTIILFTIYIHIVILSYNRISYPYVIMCVLCLHLVLLVYVLGAPRRPGCHFWARVRNQRVTFEPPVYPKTLGTADMFFTESVLSRKHIQDDRSMRWLQADQGVPM